MNKLTVFLIQLLKLVVFMILWIGGAKYIGSNWNLLWTWIPAAIAIDYLDNYNI
jgi:hypothetical protein